jgi:hypothetical protein
MDIFEASTLESQNKLEHEGLTLGVTNPMVTSNASRVIKPHYQFPLRNLQPPHFPCAC